MEDISPAPHGTEGRPRPRSPPWRRGYNQYGARSFRRRSAGLAAFCQQPCRPFRHARGSPRLLVLSKDRNTHLLFSVPCTIRSQLKCMCFFFFKLFVSPLPFQTAPPKLSVCSSYSTWTSLPCPSSPCESHPLTRGQLLCFLPQVPTY